MELIRDLNRATYQITAYEPGSIFINQQRYQHSLIISAHHCLNPWPVHSIDSLSWEAFEWVLQNPPDILLLGTGLHSYYPKTSIFETFRAQNIGFEVMNTRSACRTYVILAAEGKRVSAALIN